VDDLLTRFSRCRDFRQTSGYAAITKSIGWKAIGTPGSYLYLKHLGPLGIAKLQRPETINFAELAKFRKENHIFWTFVEPGLHTKFIGNPPKHPWYIEPYAHSATALIDLKKSESSLLKNLDTATRTKIRRAGKDLTIKTTPLTKTTKGEINQFLALATKWSERKKVIGYEAKYLQKIVTQFHKDAYFVSAFDKKELVSQLLLIKQGSLATAFCIFTSPHGYHLRAPMLVNWKSMHYAKKLGATIFDFFGIYDPRYPKMYRRWQGFSAAKMLFKPTFISFPRSYMLLGW